MLLHQRDTDSAESGDHNQLLCISQSMYLTVCSGSQELEKRYEMALELLGERNELVDKLEDDIREMKEIFHNQLSLMADQLSMAQQSARPEPQDVSALVPYQA